MNFPSHLSLTVEHNPHKNLYQTAEKWFEIHEISNDPPDYSAEMNTLPLKFNSEADVLAENYPNTIKLQCELDYFLVTRYQYSDPNEEKIKNNLKSSFHNELYGPIKAKLAEAQAFLLSSLSPTADHETALKLFKDIYAAIPKVNL